MLTFAKKILNETKKQGATDAEVIFSIRKGLEVNVRMGEIDTVKHSREKGFGVTVYLGHHLGTASSAEISQNAIEATVTKAIDIARFTAEDPYSGLAEKQLLAFNYPDLDLHYPWTISPQQAIELAKNCEAIALQQDQSIKNSGGVTVETSDCHYVYANSHEFIGAYKATYHSISCSLIANRNEDMQRDYDYTIARDPNDLLDIAALAKQAADRTVKRLGARKLKTCHVPVILSANLARGLLAHFTQAISGNNLYHKASFLTDHLYKPVFPARMTIDERPHLQKAMGSVPFDTDGVATRNRMIIEKGVLQGYLLGVYSARKLGMQPTGNADGVHNLFMSTADLNLSGLLRKMGKGLLVTELIGQGVNIVTGDYSRGAFGYWIENGEIQYPVHEVTIAGNLKDMFLNVVAVANDVDHRGSIHTGSLLLEEMIVAGM